MKLHWCLFYPCGRQEYRRTRWDTPLRRDREALDPVKQRRLGQCPISPVIVQGETFQLGEVKGRALESQK